MSDKGVLVFGANGAIGLDLCGKLIASGRRVFAAIRSDNNEPALRSLGATIIKVDLLDAASIESAVAGVADDIDCVVSVFGARPFTPPESWPDFPGNKAITDSCVSNKVDRFILMTSIGCGGSWGYQTEGMLNFLGPFLKEKTRAEDYLRASGIGWIILRPGNLGKHDNPMEPLPPTGNGIMLETEKLRGAIGRGDVAELLCQLASSRGNKAVGHVLHAVDRDMIVTEEAIRPFVLD